VLVDKQADNEVRPVKREPTWWRARRVPTSVPNETGESNMADEGTDPDAVETEAVGAVVSDGAYTLFAADFSDTATAMEAYEALKRIEDGRTVEIEGSSWSSVTTTAP